MSEDTSVADLIGRADEEVSAEVPANIINGNPDIGDPLPDVPVNIDVPVVAPVNYLEILMRRASSVEEASPYLKLFIYGFQGNGKTSLLGTAPKILLYDIEDGSKSIRNHPDRAKNVTVLPYMSSSQFDILLQGLEAEDPMLAEFETFGIDSFSALQQEIMSTYLREEASRNSMRNKYMAEGGDWNLHTQIMKDYINRIKKLKRHVIVTALAQEVKEEATGKLYIRPTLTPKVAESLGGMFDLVGFVSATTDADGRFSQTLQVHPTDKIAAKTRIGGLPGRIESPTFQILLDAFNRNNTTN